MKRDPMDALQAYYSRLDNEAPAIGCARPQSGRSVIFNPKSAILILAPAFAAAFAYGFLAFCASRPVSEPSAVPAAMYENQLRMAGLDTRMPSQPRRAVLWIPKSNA